MAHEATLAASTIAASRPSFPGLQYEVTYHAHGKAR